MPSYISFNIKNNSNRQNKMEGKEGDKEENKSNNFSNNNSRTFISSSSGMDLTNTNSSSTVDNYPKSIECNIDTNIELENIKTENEKDMLEILFNKQKELYKKQLANSENKMKNIYEIKEPFDGYRIFMLSSALVHEAIESAKEKRIGNGGKKKKV